MKDKDRDKDNSDFLLRFSNRIETMGKEGIRGIMKNTNIPINIVNSISNRIIPNTNTYKPKASFNSNDNANNNNDYVNSFQQPNQRYSPNTNQYYPYLYTNTNNNKINRVLTEGNANLNTNSNQVNYIGINTEQSTPRTPTFSLIHKPSVLNSLNYSEWKRYPNVIPDQYCNNKTETQPFINQHDIFQERLYKPYSLKDYRGLKLEIKLGGLGANIGTKDWAKRAVRMNKMGLYGSSVVKDKVGLKLFTSKTPNELREQQRKEMNEQSIRYKTNNYGRNIKLRNSNYIEKSNTQVEDFAFIPKTEIDEDYQTVLDLNKQKYFERLAKLKESLVSSNY